MSRLRQIIIILLFFQNWEERSPSAIYEEISVYRKETRGKSENSRGEKRKQENIITKLVLIISNWSFVRDNKANPRKIRCTNQDVTIGLKLASSAFRTGRLDDRRQPYDFDKNGLVLPYAAFLSLIKSTDFTSAYINKVKDHYEEDTGERLSTPVTGTGRSQPSAAAVRRRYAEAFPELAEPTATVAAANKPSRGATGKHRRHSDSSQHDAEGTSAERNKSEDDYREDDDDDDDDDDGNSDVGAVGNKGR